MGTARERARSCGCEMMLVFAEALTEMMKGRFASWLIFSVWRWDEGFGAGGLGMWYEVNMLYIRLELFRGDFISEEDCGLRGGLVETLMQCMYSSFDC